jgi:hypothetical protein
MAPSPDIHFATVVKWRLVAPSPLVLAMVRLAAVAIGVAIFLVLILVATCGLIPGKIYQSPKRLCAALVSVQAPFLRQSAAAKNFQSANGQRRTNRQNAAERRTPGGTNYTATDSRERSTVRRGQTSVEPTTPTSAKVPVAKPRSIMAGFAGSSTVALLRRSERISAI